MKHFRYRVSGIPASTGWSGPAPLFQQTDLAIGIPRRRLEHHPEIVITHRLRTGTTPTRDAPTEEERKPRRLTSLSRPTRWAGAFLLRAKAKVDRE